MMNFSMILVLAMLIVMLLLLYIRDERNLKKLKIRVSALLQLQQTLEDKLNKPNPIVNRRKYFRVQVIQNCTIQFIGSENANLNKLKYKIFQGTIENISLGGLKFTCPFNLPVKEKIMIIINFSLNNQEFSLNAQIIRKEEDFKKNFGYGVEFISLNDQDMKRLNEVIHEIELERRKNIS